MGDYTFEICPCCGKYKKPKLGQRIKRNASVILDPMGGTGITNICAGAMGFGSVSVELEGKFVGFQKLNKEYAERRLFKSLDWEMIQGDSRNLSNLLKGRGLKSITSPPYGDQVIKDGQRLASNPDIHWREWDRGTKYNLDNPDNIGNLKDIPLKSIVSPPYGEALKDTGAKRLKIRVGKGHPADYSENKDNIGNLKDKPLKSVMSLPYGDAEKRDRSKEASNEKESVMSPPYEGGGHHKGMLDSWGGANTPVSDKTKDDHGYGNTEGQVEKAESYLEAMSKVYREISLVSDVLCVVVKNPTRAGKLRRLDKDTISILEASGWKIHCQHRALLFEELEQADMFKGSKKRVKGRISFFKRLSWQNGNPVASWEDIIVAVRK